MVYFVWQKKVQVFTAVTLWHGYCSLPLTRFAVRPKVKQNDVQTMWFVKTCVSPAEVVKAS